MVANNKISEGDIQCLRDTAAVEKLQYGGGRLRRVYRLSLLELIEQVEIHGSNDHLELGEDGYFCPIQQYNHQDPPVCTRWYKITPKGRKYIKRWEKEHNA